MGHPGGASGLCPGLGSGPGGAAEVTPPEDVDNTGKQVSSLICLLYQFVVLSLPGWLRPLSLMSGC